MDNFALELGRAVMLMGSLCFVAALAGLIARVVWFVVKEYYGWPWMMRAILRYKEHERSMELDAKKQTSEQDDYGFIGDVPYRIPKNRQPPPPRKPAE